MPVRAFGRRPRAAPVGPRSAPAAPGAPVIETALPAPAAEAPRAMPLPARRVAGADPAIAEVVARVHPVVIQSLDMARIAGLDNEALATQLLGFLESPEAGVPELSPLDRQRVVTQLVHDIKGLGPIEPLLLDPDISDILVNGVHSVYVERRGRLEAVDVHFRDARHLLHIAQRIAGWIGRRVDESSPMVDARLPDGSRVNIIIPPLALDGAAISIRRFVMRGTSLVEMAERAVMSQAMAEAFRIGVRARLNILISGGTGAGKTTFMNALSREIPDGERLITIEDAAELQLQQPHVIRLETRTMSAEGTGQVTMRDLLVNTLRMRPDRIIVGEVRGGEAQEMLQAMNTGHPGSMCTLHANNPRDALIRLENMLMSASGDIPLPALRRQIAGSIDLVVQLARLRSGHRCVTSVTNVVGIENDIVTTEEMWRHRPVDGGASLRVLGAPALVDGLGGGAGAARGAARRPRSGPAHRGARGMSPLGAGLAAAVALSLLVAAAGAVVLLWRRRPGAPRSSAACAWPPPRSPEGCPKPRRRAARRASSAARSSARGCTASSSPATRCCAPGAPSPGRRRPASPRSASRGSRSGSSRSPRAGGPCRSSERPAPAACGTRSAGCRRARRRSSCAASRRSSTRWCASPAPECPRSRRWAWPRRTCPSRWARRCARCATACSPASTPTARCA